ncbi:PAS domain S-box protein [Solimonas sp. K1W22B-7]|nr:PAS domain S-box protein [Solimonas sp. K1W22B-7]
MDVRQRAGRHVRAQPALRQIAYYSQFLYRIVFAGLLFLYISLLGVAPGFLDRTGIAMAMWCYILAVTAVMVLARGQRLTPLLQRAMIFIDLNAMVVGVPHDPLPGMPTLLVFYLAYADLGLRNQYRHYVEALAGGAVAGALMLFLRGRYTAGGLSPADIWQALLLTIIVLHGLQIFAGRDRALKLARATQERLQLALDSPGLGAWSTSDPLVELKVDGHIQSVLGLEGERFSDRMSDYMDRMHPEDRPRVMERYTRFVRFGGADYEDEYRVLRPNGEVRYISSRAKAERNHLGAAVSIAGMVWDLTEQRRQQERLREMEERYRIATSAAQIAVWIWHVKEDRFEHDDSLNRLLQLRQETRALSLAGLLPVIHAEDRKAFEQRIRVALAGDQTDFFDEVRLQFEDGRMRVIQVRATILRDEKGKALRVAGANWDATRLALARQELERSNRELDDFTYIASHDLKEPLRGIASFAEYLQQDYADRLDDEGRSMIQKIRDQAKRMEQLIAELLHISRLGRSGLEREDTDLNAVLNDVLESLDFSLKEKNVALRMPRPLPRARCDRVRVGELFRNLITNAIKYNDKDERWIEIGCEPINMERVFYVRDNGIGIKPEHRGRVFTLFERLHKRDAYGGGTGVGLTIVQKIVHMHGGRIWIESVPGQRTSFYFTLPERDPDEQ